MKKLLGMVFIAGLIFACNTTKKEELKQTKEPVMEKNEQVIGGVTRFEELKGYFVKNTVDFDKDIEYVAVSNQEDFDKYFGIAKTMDNVVTPLDFEKFNVAGILLKPAKKAMKIKMTKFTAEGAKQIIGFNIETSDDQSFTSGKVLLFKIPKSRTSVDFIYDGETKNIQVK